MKTHCRVLLFLLSKLIILGYSRANILEEGVEINIENELPPGNSTSDKKALRYGFQRTKECKNFEKAYVCVRKCLDLDYDVAYADKNCRCTCYKKADISKYKPKYAQTRTKWKLGAPTTSLPSWVASRLNQSQPIENVVTDPDADDVDILNKVIKNQTDSNSTESGNETLTTVDASDGNVTSLVANVNETVTGGDNGTDVTGTGTPPVPDGTSTAADGTPAGPDGTPQAADGTGAAGTGDADGATTAAAELAPTSPDPV